ncbi:MAG: hypothetical protein NTV33_10175 [Coprothermobacterota bacterium]|nr:hypothetical protein [Coprothermobacterota bacterium]
MTIPGTIPGPTRLFKDHHRHEHPAGGYLQGSWTKQPAAGEDMLPQAGRMPT